MAVYFEPQRKSWYEGPLGMLVGTVLNDALMRGQKAKEFEYMQRLRADEDARKIAEAQRAEDAKRGYLDRAWAGIQANPHQMSGAADFITGLVGAGANMVHMQNYWIPKQQELDLGDRKISRPIYPDGQAGEESSFYMGMSPHQLGMLDIARQELALKDWKARQDAAQGWAGVSNSNRPHYSLYGDYIDENGNPIIMDSRSGGYKPLPGITRRPETLGAKDDSLARLKAASEVYKNVKGTDLYGTSDKGDEIYKYILSLMGINGASVEPDGKNQDTADLLADIIANNSPAPVQRDTSGLNGQNISQAVQLYMKMRPGLTPEQALMEMKEVQKRRMQEYRYNK